MSKYPGRIVSNLAPAGYSVFFDGTGDYLNTSPTAFGSGNFTIECWVYLTGSVASKGIFHVATSSVLPGTVSGVAVASGASGGWNFYWGGNQNTNTSLTAALNTWIHIAVVKSGTTISLYINGILNQSQTDTANYTNQVAAIGGFFSTSFLMTGNISNFRMVNSALYSGTSTTTANFNLPTQLLNITGTSLLTCNSPAIVDQSTNNFTITANGNSAVSTFTPFTAYVPYNPALGASTPGIWTVDEAMQAAATRQWNMYDPSFNLTTLLLHGNGTNGAQNNTFLDSSSNNFTITRNPASGPNAPTQGTFSPFSQTGWSNFFTAASSQFISLPNNAAFQFGAPSGNTNDFVVEFFVYPTTTAISAPVHTGYTSGTTYWGFNLNRTTGGVNTAGHVQFYLTDSFNVTATTGLISNQQNHICAVRTGTTVSLFVNGVRQATGTSSVNPNPTGLLYVGGEALSLGRYLDGYVSNLRIIKGATLPYDANALSITVPTSQLTAITGTTVLTCQSNRFVDNSTNNFTISTSGTPSVQAFSPFYPTAAYTPQTIGGSGFFDGTGDYLTVADNTAFEFGSSEFCVELFAYVTATDSSGTVFAAQWNSPNRGWILGYVNSGSTLNFDYSTNGSNSTSLSVAVTFNLNSWNHIVACRSGNTLSTYLNGSRVGTASMTGVTIFAPNQALEIGRNVEGVTTWEMNGYIAGLRITKGSSPYNATLSTLTVPTSPPTAITNTSLLLNFTNAGVVDSTAKNVLETVGNAQISTAFSKFGGSSIAFDGTGDYLVAPSRATSSLEANFTIEGWVYRNNADANFRFFTLGDSFLSSGIEVYVSSGNWVVYSQSTRITGSSATKEVWTHIAVVRSGSSVTLYINGSASGGVWTSASATFSGAVYVGAENFNGGVSADSNGYIDDFRITKGVARYTGNFTPQTSQWQDQ